MLKCFMVNPKYKPALFLLSTFVVMAPYLGSAMYFSLQYPSHRWPDWLVNTLAIWFVANFFIVWMLARVMSKGQVVDPEKARVAVAKSIGTSIRLVILWSALFIYGVAETVQGKFPLRRAIPAGTLLLFFIGIFGWSIYRAKHKKAL
jgi:hypothetical protein